VKVAKNLRYREEQMLLDPPVPHLHHRLLKGAFAEHRRRRMKAFEVAADRDRFGDHGAVVQHQGRNPLERVDGRIGRRFVLHRPEVDLLAGNRDAFFGQIDPHAPRIGRAAAVIELHCGCPPCGPREARQGRKRSQPRQPVRTLD
jgi:hypothetical protein